ncbi:MAG: efflux RND transporter permease subunit [Bacteroidia bacterium]|nr:efflux RND transporter permease subunit [Bacteroidia bacterium]
MMIFTFLLVGIVKPKIVFFPDNEPQSFFVHIGLPVETHQNVTDSVTMLVEQKIIKVLGKDNPVVEDEFPIILRFNEKIRENINTLLEHYITFRDMNTGVLKSIPLSAVAKIEYSDSYGGIKRLNMKRVISLSSEILPGYNANDIQNKISGTVENFPRRSGVTINMTGEREEMDEASRFLMKAMLISLGLIFFILIAQFNSFSKSVIILSEVIFSIIGVLLGIMIFGMSVSVALTGLGIVALGGIVVRNGILIVEFTDVLKASGMKTREAIIQTGKIRITPVVLTATATMLGLVPLAVGMNIDFCTCYVFYGVCDEDFSKEKKNNKIICSNLMIMK